MKNKISTILLLILIIPFCVSCSSKGQSMHGNLCEHHYVQKITAPTCVAQGYTTNTCSLCGDCYTDNYKAALGHDFIEGTATYSCSRCGHYQDAGFSFELDQYGKYYTLTGVTSKECISNGILDIPYKHLGLPVSSISRNAFITFRKDIVKIIFHSNIKKIGVGLLSNADVQETSAAALTEVVFDSDCANIDIECSAFYNCEKLEKVEFPTGCFSSVDANGSKVNFHLFENTKYYSSNVIEENGLFYIQDILLSSNSSKVSNNIEIKAGTRVIGNYVFHDNTNIKRVTIPTSVTGIGGSAFKNCVNMTDIIYTGTKAEFKKIKIGNGAFLNDTNTYITYVEGE